jgi:putative hemin transport protein
MTAAASSDLKQLWADFRRDNPSVRIRDAAAKLGVSEAELVATGCGDGTTRIGGNWTDFLTRIPELGRVMALTRNESAVHERKGIYNQPVMVHGTMGQVLGADIDLRLFLNAWHVGFAVVEEAHGETRRSFQVFDPHGVAVHKIYLQEESDVAAYEAITNAFRSEDQSTAQFTTPAQPRTPDRADGEIDAAGLLEAWAGLQDTHDFFGLLRKFKVGRLQAVRLAEGKFTRQIGAGSVQKMLEAAAESGMPIMVFVGNDGVIQIHTGPVHQIKMHGPWLNVLDDEFNLHLRSDHVASAWVVEKPTRDGTVTAVEIYDPAGQNIALFFGKRKPGELESDAWRALVATLE